MVVQGDFNAHLGGEGYKGEQNLKGMLLQESWNGVISVLSHKEPGHLDPVTVFVVGT